MQMYKHFVTISSQLYFCSSPIRLDSYNRCQFGCVYCFSRKRAQDTSEVALKQANPFAFAKRLERVQSGVIKSALDEFLAAKVPIQLGGLQDPFSPLDVKKGVTLELLKILRDHDYPTLISTKGNLFLRDEYWDVLCDMDVYIRLSAAAVPEDKRKKVDAGADGFTRTCNKIRVLSESGFAVSLRIQPVFPGFEDAALRMTKRAAEAGVRHVSFEHLKLGTEGLEQQCKTISNILGCDIWQSLKSRGMKRVGRDYTLRTAAKLDFLVEAKELCRSLGIRFGAGDTEFIHLSDGTGCCNGSAYFFKSATQFRANFVGVLSNKGKGREIRFGELANAWHPTMSVHSYLTTDSRGRDKTGRFNSWMSLLAHRWNGGKGPYSPEFFYGVTWEGEYDDMGFKVYKIKDKI
jgi:DNA repair photolyase